MTSSDVQQTLVAVGVGEGLGTTQRCPDRSDRGGGQSVAVGVDADDASMDCVSMLTWVPLLWQRCVDAPAAVVDTQAEL